MKKLRTFWNTFHSLSLYLIISILLFLNAAALCIFFPKVPTLFILRIFWAIFIVFGGFFGVIGILVSIEFLIFSILEKRKKEKAYQKSLVEIKKLPNHFSKVILKELSYLDDFISKDDLECLARLDENGTVTVQLHLSATCVTSNYQSFLNSFKIPTDEP